MDTSTKLPPWVSLAAAALFGATLVGVSAFWLHKRAIDYIVNDDINKVNDLKKSRRHTKAGTRARDFRSRSCSRDRSSSLVSDSLPHVRSRESVRVQQNLQGPAPDVGINSQGSFGNLTSIPPGLPRVHTGANNTSNSIRRAMPLPNAGIRPTTPKSPLGGSAFDSMESSDGDEVSSEPEEQVLDYEQVVNGDTGAVNTAAKQKMMEDVVRNSLSTPAIIELSNGGVDKSCNNMIRSHSIPGELHGAHDPVAADILRKEPEQETFVRLNITPIEAPSEEEIEVCSMLQECLELRNKYVYRETVAPWYKEELTDPSTPNPNPDPFHYEQEPASKHVFRMVDGVVHVYADEEELFPVIGATEFFTDMHRILKIVSIGNVRTLCHHRLRLLEQKFSLHLMLNADREFLAQKSAPHRDFYNVRKVDTHVHHSACMNQKHLLRFIKSKLRKEPDEVVIFRDGKYLTLSEVFISLDLTGYDLNVDLLDVHADKNTFHRFDKFNLKYNPCGQSRLREIFLKQDNLIQGRFLAELTKQVFQDLAQSKYQMAEYRISIYGRKQSEWDQLASWFVNNELYSENVVWLIQLPRLYNVYKEMGIVNSFQNMLDNVFIPLFEVTVDPGSHPQLHVFLEQVVGFDLVDDESKPERRPTKHMPIPSNWDIIFNPAYSYYAYYVYANLYTLNKLRESKGMKTIRFRPHAGEAGDIDHLVAAFLLTHNIAHGNNLRKSPGLQYLYYLAQIGLCMSPLSNNSLFLDYHRNPFPMFFARGMNVSLSTDDPLQIHLTKEPLVEEYSVAAQVWKLSPCDLCEIARNSVYQSGFSHSLKSHWIGKDYFKRGPEGNDVHKTNVPHMRVEFRHEVWKEELAYVYQGDIPIKDEFDP
ncbi:hypothetical protein KP509_37G013600 [Ceratopteris richardii]|uniref:AMP deaminase n=1 Tax=Ceratopteris richardii TaxID=49495 RepID=A0A8T2Q6M8_CERRI|nr:hypothetical protein KP509_37G013600 [Ceratopteris richardii]